MKRSLCLLLSPVTYLVSCIVPRDPKKVAFGAWGGLLFSDNPKYLYLYLFDQPDVEICWIGTENLRKRVFLDGQKSFRQKNSLSALWFLMRAKTWVCCQGVDDLTSYAVHGGNIRFINLWHGIPLKYMGQMSPGKGANLQHTEWYWRPFHYVARMLTRCVPRIEECYATSSPDMTKFMEMSFPTRFSQERSLPIGSPRIDYLINNKDNQVLKQLLKAQYSDKLGFSPDCKVILYAPTWRLSGAKVFTFGGLDSNPADLLQKVLRGNNAVLVEKLHPNTYRFISQKSDGASVVIDKVITIPPSKFADFDVQEFLLITDLLITDYSSLYFDFAALRRPCCHYVYDIDEYTNKDSGLAYDMRNVAGGPLIKDFDSLVAYIDTALRTPRFEPAPELSRLMEYETGSACRKFCDHVLNLTA